MVVFLSDQVCHLRSFTQVAFQEGYITLIRLTKSLLDMYEPTNTPLKKQLEMIEDKVHADSREFDEFSKKIKIEELELLVS